ncbi:MAG: translation initiation factor IF-2, partial [Candidatus Komeilibacteria bacterium]|nr:translation initiation factor IF-2 [Candidatus Komeilibacteria bacterium]
ELLELLPKLGFAIGARAIKVDDRLVDKIGFAIEHWRHEQELQQRNQAIKEVHLGDKGEKINKREVVVKVPKQIIVREFAEKLQMPVTRVIAELMKNGILSSLNDRIDYDTASIIGEDLGFTIERLNEEEQETSHQEATNIKLKELLATKNEDLESRPPVVVVMGHVDHGKTKLLDAIRETHVMESESGGITQHIGAYQVKTKDRLITFLDTPGHEAFKAMRSRGSQIADVAIIVVAADDGLQPQTLEVLELVQKENVPFVVAINKIDKDSADPDRVKQQLAELNLVPEEWGGKVICVPISAKAKTGINELLDMVLLVADLKNFQANVAGPAVGTIIEAKVDKAEGPVATVLVQSGTLRVGDWIVVGKVAGKIKTLKNYLAQPIKEATPSMPVRILGLKQIPQVGDILEATADERRYREALKQIDKISRPQEAGVVSTTTTEESGEKVYLQLILKTDVLGSQEAIAGVLEGFQNPQAGFKLVRKGLGNITEGDVLDAASGGALIIAYRVVVSPVIKNLASEKGVDIVEGDVIYHVFDIARNRLQEKLPSETIATQLGSLKVLAIFKTEKHTMVLGGKVILGRVKMPCKVKLLRDKEVITYGEVLELQSGKQVMTEVVEGQEAGLKIKIDPIIQVGDILEFYQEEVKRIEIKLNN